MEWTPCSTIGALPDDAFNLLDPDIDAVLFQVQSYFIYVPGIADSQKSGLQFLVFLRTSCG